MTGMEVPKGAKIGPNAILQLVPVVEDAAGADMTKHLLTMAGVFELPDPDAGLMDEGPAARLHQALRAEMPEVAPMLAREAGWRTGDYILAHRIPKGATAPAAHARPARRADPRARGGKTRLDLLRLGRVPAGLTWPVVFEIVDNPVVRGEHSETPLCHWHAAVFERLFSTLCGRDWRCAETRCCAQGAASCRFEMHRD
jgi:divinyl protochlorophyllide a 8-vinyl-reductase